MEIITGVERRRRWRLEDKRRIVAEVEQPGALFATVARWHELSRGQLWSWRRQVRCGALAPEPTPVFMPVQITADAPLSDRPLIAPPGSGLSQAAPAEAARIEIALPDGTCIRVGADVGLVALGRVMAAVRRLILSPSGVRVWLANGHTDMRRGMNGLALQVQQALQRNPHAGDLYVFRGRKGDLVKILWHDGLGM